MMKKTVLMMILAAVMLLTAVSCSTVEEETKMEPTPSVQTETQAESETTLEDLIPDSLPQKTFNGASFNIIKWSDGGAWDLTEFAADEFTGELLTDEVYKRNMIIEKKYDVTIQSENNSQPIEQIKQLVVSGDTTYQAVTDWPSRMANAATANILLDFYTVPNLDLDAAWWDHNASRAYTIQDKMYFTTGEFVLFDKQRVFCVVFNRTLADMLQIDNLYDTVREGKITYNLHSNVVPKGRLLFESTWSKSVLRYTQTTFIVDS